MKTMQIDRFAAPRSSMRRRRRATRRPRPGARARARDRREPFDASVLGRHGAVFARRCRRCSASSSPGRRRGRRRRERAAAGDEIFGFPTAAPTPSWRRLVVAKKPKGSRGSWPPRWRRRRDRHPRARRAGGAARRDAADPRRAGVVGSVAVQLARLRGARVIATGRAANQALLASLGANAGGGTATAWWRGCARSHARRRRSTPRQGRAARLDRAARRQDAHRHHRRSAAHQLGIPFSAGTAEMRNVAVLRTMAELATSGKVTVAVRRPCCRWRRRRGRMRSSRRATRRQDRATV